MDLSFLAVAMVLGPGHVGFWKLLMKSGESSSRA